MSRKTNHRRDHRGLVALAGTVTLLCIAPFSMALDGDVPDPEIEKAAAAESSEKASEAKTDTPGLYMQAGTKLTMREKVDLYNSQPGVDPIVCRREKSPGSNLKKLRCVAKSTRESQAEMARRTIRMSRQGQFIPVIKAPAPVNEGT